MNTNRTPDRNPNPDTWKGKYDFSKLPEIGDLMRIKLTNDLFPDGLFPDEDTDLFVVVLSEVEEIQYSTTAMGLRNYALVFLGMKLYEDGRTDIFEMCFAMSEEKHKWVIVCSAQKEEGNETEEG